MTIKNYIYVLFYKINNQQNDEKWFLRGFVKVLEYLILRMLEDEHHFLPKFPTKGSCKQPPALHVGRVVSNLRLKSETRLLLL